jgi:hypothetical protein
MRCYNPAMRRPFQFSLGGMLLAVGWLCFAAAAVKTRSWLGIAIASEFTIVSIGAAVGSIMGDMMRGIIWGCWAIGLSLAGLIVFYIFKSIILEKPIFS